MIRCIKNMNLLENIANGNSYRIDLKHAANAIDNFYEAEKFSILGDKKKIKKHNKEFKKYYSLILHKNSKEYVQGIVKAYYSEQKKIKSEYQ